jgi:hypothetical protein
MIHQRFLILNYFIYYMYGVCNSTDRLVDHHGPQFEKYWYRGVIPSEDIL